MIRLFLILLPFLAIGCKFNSFYEASLGCEEWKADGGIYNGIVEAIKMNNSNVNKPEYLFKETKNSFPMRKCQVDKETNQIIGLKILNREENKNYYFKQSQRLKDSPDNLLDMDLKWDIEKRFKY